MVESELENMIEGLGDVEVVPIGVVVPNKGNNKDIERAYGRRWVRSKKEKVNKERVRMRSERRDAYEVSDARIINGVSDEIVAVIAGRGRESWVTTRETWGKEMMTEERREGDTIGKEMAEKWKGMVGYFWDWSSFNTRLVTEEMVVIEVAIVEDKVCLFGQQ